jgi:hypothetical protein
LVPAQPDLRAPLTKCSPNFAFSQDEWVLWHGQDEADCTYGGHSASPARGPGEDN